MIVKVSNRGFSFKGAGQYYLHDKRNDENRTVKTSERVGFIYAHNLQTDSSYKLDTDDARNALSMMAYTAMNAEALKKEVGVSTKGRKATLGEVYSYSLSWDNGQSPDEQTMMDAAMSSLEFLKLDKDYQSLFVQHTDTPHPHVHVIVNLVSPIDGKVAGVGNDQVKLSGWAEQYEREHGGIVVETRVENNQKRRELSKEKERRKAEREAERQAKKLWDKAEREKQQQAKKNGEVYEVKPFKKRDRDTGVVKHRERKIDKAQIQEIYLQSQTAAEFQESLKRAGYTLARGDRRDLVLVDNETYKPHSLSRQISGLWKKDENKAWKGGLENRFADFDKNALSNIEETIASLEQRPQERTKVDRLDATLDTKKPSEQDNTPQGESIGPYYEKVDREREIDSLVDLKRAQQEKKLRAFYKKGEPNKAMKYLAEQRAKLKALGESKGRNSRAYRKLLEEIQNQEKTVANQNWRIEEAQQTLDKQIEEYRAELEKTQGVTNEPVIDMEAEKKRLAEEFKEKVRQREAEKKRKRDHDQDHGHSHKL